MLAVGREVSGSSTAHDYTAQRRFRPVKACTGFSISSRTSLLSIVVLVDACGLLRVCYGYIC